MSSISFHCRTQSCTIQSFNEFDWVSFRLDWIGYVCLENRILLIHVPCSKVGFISFQRCRQGHCRSTLHDNVLVQSTGKWREHQQCNTISTSRLTKYSDSLWVSTKSEQCIKTSKTYFTFWVNIPQGWAIMVLLVAPTFPEKRFAMSLKLHCPQHFLICFFRNMYKHLWGFKKFGGRRLGCNRGR